MDRLIYTSLSAMRGAMARQQATANNLANASTPGFRGEIAEAQALWLDGPSLTDRAMASEEVVNADMKAGSITATGRDLDIALGGDSLLAVQADDGDEAYTRRGDLQLSSSGLLTTGDGRPVLGQGGPITLPPADKISIAEDGRILVVPAGGDPSQSQEVDRLKIASPAGSAIAKGLDGLFRVKGGGVLPVDPDAHVTSGQLEESNVSATKALVDMIDASRAWDTQLKLITSARDLDGASAELMRLPQ
ncbi:flagellar basal-body rod protein FlgF [Sphingomonas limnosediminicola]|uniref:Flagellar basal-body rod protein FlgF n=1 Tax=Sphingomonas limnosediminicola TaxID=940133 RepID=A0ABP7L2Z3_9SPHN